MTKHELLHRYRELLALNGMTIIDNVYSNSTKAVIQNGIDCLECDNERLDAYMEAFKTEYPKTHKAINNNGDWKRHFFNRIYVFNAARLILREVR